MNEIFKQIDHIGIAVADLDIAISTYRNQFHLNKVHREVVEQQGVEAVLIEVGNSHIELLFPLSDNSPVGRFLTRHGAGLHHVAYKVSDITAVLKELSEKNIQLIDKEPRKGILNSKVAFIHPSSVNGVLTELVERD